MCGFIGCFASEPNPRFNDSLEKIAHRGPDGTGTYLSDNKQLELGHRRLSIIDPSAAGNQPMRDLVTGCVMVFNGEIYNFVELRKELVEQGVLFKGHSDSEVLFQLLQRDGVQILPRLRGIFTFAFYRPESNTLIIGRDALGVKPLYFKATDQGVVFGSELKALVHLMPQNMAIEPIAIYRHLGYIWAPGELSAAQGFLSLGPGEVIEIKDAQIERQWAWYRLPLCRAPAKLRSIRPALDGVVHHLEKAVNRQMISDVPVGAFLSGGVDSSAIVALAKRQVPDIQCFTIDTPDDEDGFSKDLPFAQAAAKHLGVKLEIIKVGADRMINDLEKMVLQLDEPLADPAALNAFYISQHASKMGFKVLLSGAGGDDIFTGYRRHQALIVEKYLSWLPRSMRHQLDVQSQKLDQRYPLGRRLAKLFRGANLSGDERLVNSFRWINTTNLNALLTPEFRANIPDGIAEAPMLAALEGLPVGISPVERMLILEQRFFLTDHNLIYTDRMSMAAGVEVRVPFLDEDLIAFAATIPDRFKQRFGVGKWILKKAMEPYLPKDILYRPKTGFGAPLRSWIRGPLQTYVDDILSIKRLTQRNIFDASAVRNLVADNYHGRVDAAYTIFSILCIEIWCSHFIDAPTQPCHNLASNT